jgi:hypothetical protein
MNAALFSICKADLILFVVQVSIIFMVTLFSLINLTYQWGNQNLWTVVLTSSLGYIMPNPKIKISDGNIEKTIKDPEVTTLN